MTEPWFDDQTAGLVGGGIGSLVGVWGAVVGCLAGWLIPRSRGRRVIFGLLSLGVAAGAVGLAAGITAAADGQPRHVWYAVGFPGFMLLQLAVPFVFVARGRYRRVEEQRMAAQDFG